MGSWPQLLDQPLHALPLVGNHPKRYHIATVRVRDHHGEPLGVDVQADVSDMLLHDWLLSLVALRYDLPIASVTYELAIGASRPILTTLAGRWPASFLDHPRWPTRYSRLRARVLEAVRRRRCASGKWRR